MKRLIRLILALVPRKYIQRVAHIATPIMGLFYMGRGVECPICGAQYRRFMPYGYVTSRENALCPRCLALERHRLLWLYLQSETELFDGYIKLLHVAPEICFIKRFKKALGEQNYITSDLESPLATVKADIQNMPFEDNSFDMIICNHILEHVDDDRKALSEIFRMLRPGGRAILLCPVNDNIEHTIEDPTVVDPLERERLFGQKDHLREYGRDYPQRIEQAGFSCQSNDYIETLSDEKIKLYGLRSEVIYVGDKI